MRKFQIKVNTEQTSAAWKADAYSYWTEVEVSGVYGDRFCVSCSDEDADWLVDAIEADISEGKVLKFVELAA